MLFREFSYFGDEESTGWNTSGFNWIESAYGTKIAVVDLNNKFIHVLSAPDTDAGSAQVAAVSGAERT